MGSAKKGDIESIKQHIAFGTDLNLKGSSRDETALIIASCQGHYEVVKLLIDEGCLLYTSPSPRDVRSSRMPSSA